MAMTNQEIIDRLNDIANDLEKHPNQQESAISFLRATAVRIRRDAELQHKIALVVNEHNLKITMEDLEECREIEETMNRAIKGIVRQLTPHV
jgi:hypothetical protein